MQNSVAATSNPRKPYSSKQEFKKSAGALQPPRFEFYDPQTPIYTSPRFLPPAKVVKSKINDAIISHGSYLEECTVSNAIVGLRSRISKGAVIQVTFLVLLSPPLQNSTPLLECSCIWSVTGRLSSGNRAS